MIAIIQDKLLINKILESVGEATEPPELSPAKEPLIWDDYHLNPDSKNISILDP